MVESYTLRFNRIKEQFIPPENLQSLFEISTLNEPMSEPENDFFQARLEEWYQRFLDRNRKDQPTEEEKDRLAAGQALYLMLSNYWKSDQPEKLKLAVKQVLEASQEDEALNGLFFFEYRLPVIIGMLAL